MTMEELELRSQKAKASAARILAAYEREGFTVDEALAITEELQVLVKRRAKEIQRNTAFTATAR